MDFDFVRRGFEAYFAFLSYPPTQWIFIGSCVALALIVYVLQQQTVKISIVRFLSFVFPKRIYLHVSTRTDLLFVLILPIVSIL